MTKLSKQNKTKIYHLLHDYQISVAKLSKRYQARKSNIGYLLALIVRHSLVILD